MLIFLLFVNFSLALKVDSQFEHAFLRYEFFHAQRVTLNWSHNLHIEKVFLLHRFLFLTRVGVVIVVVVAVVLIVVLIFHDGITQERFELLS